jgi:hypothetical protein
VCDDTHFFGREGELINVRSFIFLLYFLFGILFLLVDFKPVYICNFNVQVMIPSRQFQLWQLFETAIIYRQYQFLVNSCRVGDKKAQHKTCNNSRGDQLVNQVDILKLINAKTNDVKARCDQSICDAILRFIAFIVLYANAEIGVLYYGRVYMCTIGRLDL